MGELRVECRASGSLSPTEWEEVLALCALAYDEPLQQYFSDIGPGVHVLARLNGALVSHAIWVTRWLQPGQGPPLRTAYVEVVATHPAHARQGLASLVMERLVAELPDDVAVAALCPATMSIYLRLGWRSWEGPLGVRLPSGELLPTPAERVMVLPLPGRPELDLTQPLSVEWRPGEMW